jgi:metal-sulfur cluster biosynthetic enzyme
MGSTARRHGSAIVNTDEHPTEQRIREELQRIPEPCGLLMREPIDICEMGLVDEVDCADGHVRIVLVLTDASCVHFSGLQRYIGDVVGALAGVRSVKVTASTTKMWTPDRRRTSLKQTIVHPEKGETDAADRSDVRQVREQVRDDQARA